ncbi:plant expansin [Mycena latifolia]|nr:plant expansin [Mycena latifolia]
MSLRSMLFVIAFVFVGSVHSTALDARAKVHTGDGPGACGKTNTPDDLIVAVSHELFDHFANPICGKKLKATHGGKSVTVTVEDRCAGCSGRGDLDFSPAGFKKLAPLSVGRIHNVKWEFV